VTVSLPELVRLQLSSTTSLQIRNSKNPLQWKRE
jgi:hypothetical protein